jgi:hypothetical protein
LNVQLLFAAEADTGKTHKKSLGLPSKSVCTPHVLLANCIKLKRAGCSFSSILEMYVVLHLVATSVMA